MNLENTLRDVLKKPTGAITIADMESLPKSLDLGEKNISNIEGLQYATNVTYLRLANNNITDLSPLSNLTELRTLYAFNNKIGDVSFLSKLTKLQHLSISNNNISDISPIRNLTNLIDINFGECNITDFSPIENLPNVDYIDLSNNNISDISTIKFPKSTTELVLMDNNITDISSLERLSNLTMLMLDGNTISDISVLSRLSKLELVALSNNNISNISSLGGLRSLVGVYLDNNNISDISILGTIPSLENVSFANNKISDISALENLTNISIWFAENNQITSIPDSLENQFLNNPDLYEHNLLEGYSNQKQLTFKGDSSITVNLGNNLTADDLLQNVFLKWVDVDVKFESPSEKFNIELYDSDSGATIDSSTVFDKPGVFNIKAKINTGNPSTNPYIVTDNLITLNVVDSEKPTAKYELSTYAPTKDPVSIKVTAKDNDAISKIVLPDGTIVTENNVEFEVKQNGIYRFTIFDNSSNIEVLEVPVRNIDNLIPKISAKILNSNWTNKTVDIQVTASDDLEISHIKLPNGTTSKLLNFIYTVDKNSSLEFTVTDNVGNTSSATVKVTNIDKDAPSISTKTSNLKDNNTVDVEIAVNESLSGLDYLNLPDGSKTTNSKAKLNISKNGIYKINAVDKAGNISESVININQIKDTTAKDDQAPSITYTLSETSMTNKDVLINVLATDNTKVKEITLPDGNKQPGNAVIYKADKNGNYLFKATDINGNSSTITVPITNIDKSTLSATIEQSELLSNKTVDLTVRPDKDLDDISEIRINDSLKLDAKNPTLNVDKNGTYQVYIEDVAKNATIATTRVDKIPFSGVDTENPELNYLLDNYNWTNGKVTINLYALDNQGIKEILLPNGKAISDSNASFDVTKNGDYTFIATDLSGNQTSLSVNVSNIDNTVPNIKYNIIESSSDFVEVSIDTEDDLSGIEGIVLPNNVLTKDSSATFIAEYGTENTITVSDKAGNLSSKQFKLDSKPNTDDSKPEKPSKPNNSEDNEKPNRPNKPNNSEDKNESNKPNDDKYSGDNNKPNKQTSNKTDSSENNSYEEVVDKNNSNESADEKTSSTNGSSTDSDDKSSDKNESEFPNGISDNSRVCINGLLTLIIIIMIIIMLTTKKKKTE